ncbi:MAG TPA: hypothetical protein VGQ48_04275 [Gemmatimonadales bacterium]|jgi:Cu/Ag efflux protein CusF|nr:hypothetical protein [Gemmatimonadales bacterium]
MRTTGFSKMAPLAVSAALLACAAVPASAQVVQKAAPCCRIQSIDARTGVITVKENATGATCQYRVADAGRVRTLKVGQAVDATVLPEAQPVHGTPQAAASGCGWNGPRGADTRPKDCKDPKTGKPIACPPK